MPSEATQFISCTSCRARKVKCSGQKPICHNCDKRGDVCAYDQVVKRRGPDKLPGGRIKDGLKRTTRTIETLNVPSVARSRHRKEQTEDHTSTTATSIAQASHPPLYIPPGCLKDAREGWWIWTLNIFSKDREEARTVIHGLCRAYFQRQHIWFTYLNRATFYRSLYGTDPSTPLAPHLVLAMLACQTFVSEGKTQVGQFKAFRFADSARMIIDYYLIAGSKCPSLAAAALLLVDLELEPHVLHSEARCRATFQYLDAVTTAVFRTRLDVDHPEVSRGPLDSTYPLVKRDTYPPVESEMVPRFKVWADTPQWNDSWSLGEIRKEEMRRMCWTAASKTTAWMSFRYFVGQQVESLPICSSHNYALLFPGEASLIQNGQATTGKTTIWALYCRVLAIWHFITSREITDEERTKVLRQLAIIEQGLMIHSQRGHTEYVWQTADTALGACLYPTISHPDIHHLLHLAVRRKIGAVIPSYTPIWFARQKAVMQKFALALADPSVEGPSILDKPILGWWYLVQARIAIGVAQRDAAMWGDADIMLGMVYKAEDALLAQDLEAYVLELPRRTEEAYTISLGDQQFAVTKRV